MGLINLFMPSPPPSPPFPSTMNESMPSFLPRSRPKTNYYHNGIGGRGNYHKRAEKADPPSREHRPHFPRSIVAFFNIGSSGNLQKRNALAAEDGLSHGKVRESHFPSKWLIGIGGLGDRRSLRQRSPSSDMSATTVTSEYSNQALPLGAADVIRRKILGERSAPKNGDD